MDATKEPNSMADAIVARLAEILQEVDMDICSQRQINNKLAEEFGEGVYEYKALIKEQTHKLVDQQAAEQPSPDDDTAEPASNKRKRGRNDDTNEAPKILRPSATDGEFAVELSHSRQVRVSKFKGSVNVSIREWYDKDGSSAPGKGISLQLPQWNELAAHLDAIATAISDEDTDYVCKLSQNRHLSVKHFKGKIQVDIREFYEKGGELLPGKKGIALDLGQWDKLVEAVPDVNAAVQEQKGQASHAGAAPAKDAQAGAAKTAGATSTAVAETSTAAAEPATAAAEPGKARAGASSEASQLPIQLSAVRKADVSDFKGTVYVSIREYYEKDGKQLPGKKGISLPGDQFHRLVEAQSPLTEALEAQDAQFEIALSGKRKASVSVFKGKPMVDIREFYEKNGKQMPGAKGISLPPEQWHALTAGFALLDTALKEQTS